MRADDLSRLTGFRWLTRLVCFLHPDRGLWVGAGRRRASERMRPGVECRRCLALHPSRRKKLNITTLVKAVLVSECRLCEYVGGSQRGQSPDAVWWSTWPTPDKLPVGHLGLWKMHSIN